MMAINRIALVAVTVLSLALSWHVQAFQITNTRQNPRLQTERYPSYSSTTTTTNLQMGLFDFFKSRENDFVKLNDSQDVFGLGPLIILYNIPNEIQNDEIQDMIQDGAPLASASSKGKGNGNGVLTRRIYPSDLTTTYKDATVEQVLSKVQTLGNESESSGTCTVGIPDPSCVPILYFSGMANQEMMQTYNIIAREIHDETQGRVNAACAKLVEPALNKSFRQLVEEIGGDHADAMRSSDSGD